jgi:hypothetical protein
MASGAKNGYNPLRMNRGFAMPEPMTTAADTEIQEGIRRARAALRADLPKLMASWWTRGKLACYGVHGRIAIGRNYLRLLRYAIQLNVPDSDFIIEKITWRAGCEAEEEIDGRNI